MRLNGDQMEMFVEVLSASQTEISQMSLSNNQSVIKYHHYYYYY